MEAKDLSTDFPRSPRETVGGYVVAGRTLDKCRAQINNSIGDYHFDCPLDNVFFDFAEITAEDFKNYVATGASDDEVGQWIQDNAKKRDKIDIIKWNNKMRGMRISEMPDPLQEFLEGYIPEFIPQNKIVYVWFDVYDIEEDRI
ncbi:MAG: DUF5069 domain-containing protein [Candidatus Latescibacteria bacterium]|jgi:hypothetical protein|nr:DUF5069 domain-containing protein [Candidatus Latescibacterota bacterium]MBT4141145.1 DUF5069 domain-containing protein [Candidatus Latescibacterota bacterium]MBT5831749.1 DUF5069 domain-containing protein [Candidatus Latescibacterota bacterium]